MPTYTWRNKETGEEWTERMSIAERETFLTENPNVEQKIVSIATVDSWGISHGAKPPADFMKGVIGKIKDKVPGANKDALEKRWHVPREW